MTPKLRLREQARKTLLSSMRKFRLPGNSLTIASTQMIDAPKRQAGFLCVSSDAIGHLAWILSDGRKGDGKKIDEPIPLMIQRIHPRVSLPTVLATRSMVRA
jgi:hypothetical protein